MARWEGVDIIKWVAKTKNAPREAINIFAFEVFKRIVERTPVDTGQARGAWLPSIDQPADGLSEKDPSGQRTIAKIEVVCMNAKDEQSILLTNNLPYIRKLEFGGYPKNPKKGTWVKGKGRGKNKQPGHYEIRSEGGYSRQSPEGMIGKTLAQADQLFEEAVEAAKNRQ
jgi:hypothetical protein